MDMKYEVGDVLLIKSKIQPYSPYDKFGEIRVCTSCDAGYDRFKKDGIVVENGYVIHEVVVKNMYVSSKGKAVYRCTNNLSTTGMGWQDVAECDVIRRVNKSRKQNNRRGIHRKWNTEHMEQVSQICKDFKPKQTNADRIRAMSDEELAEWLAVIDHYYDDGECVVNFGDAHVHDSKDSILEWLQSEVN